MKRSTKYIGIAGAAIIAAISSGCASMEQAYIPSQIGNLSDNSAIDGLEMTIAPDKSTARIGDVITFSIILKNVSGRSVIIPTDPEILLTWVYPDGKRDNIIRGYGDNGTQHHGTVVLAPGSSRVYRSAVTTYYFDRKGITEFRARANVALDTASALAGVWQGDIASNGYGVMFQD